LSAAGFDVAERPFEFSEFPGRLGTPLAGAVIVVSITTAAALSMRGEPDMAIVVLLVGMVAVIASGAWLARVGVLSAPLMRSWGTNLEATRSADSPKVWLVAHIDSKWQPVPTLVRTVGIVGLSIVWLLALVTAYTTRAGLTSVDAWPAAMGGAWVVGLPVLLSFVGDRGPGAADNATGVAAVLEAARLLPPNIPVGVLITDAEELGLAGARAWLRSRLGKRGIALNCDTIDDAGRLTEMRSGSRRGVSLQPAARALGIDLRVMGLLPGVLTDSVAFVQAGWQSVTLSRGTLRTLQKIHTTGDSLEHVRGSGIDVAAQLLARAAQELS
jgi:hypothetical protein